MNRIRIIALLAGVFLSFTIPGVVSADTKPIYVSIDGAVREYVAPSVMISNGRVLVPMKSVFEELGASLEWDQESKAVTGRRGDHEFRLLIGRKEAFVNGAVVTLDVAASVIDGRTLVPLRFAAEALGADVRWDPGTSMVVINSKKPNVQGVIGGVGEGEIGNIDYCSSGEKSKCGVEMVYGGVFSFFLPDGEYVLTHYYDSLTRQNFAMDIPFTIREGKLNGEIVYEKPQTNIEGTISTDEGHALSGGYVFFYVKGTEHGAWVNDGKFRIYLPDGTYQLSYLQFFDSPYAKGQVLVEDAVTVMGGEIVGSADFIYSGND